jgi:hypothetical protein
MSHRDHAASEAARNALEYRGRCIGDCGVIADAVQGVQFSWNESCIGLADYDDRASFRPLSDRSLGDDGADQVTRCVAKRRAVSR